MGEVRSVRSAAATQGYSRRRGWFGRVYSIDALVMNRCNCPSTAASDWREKCMRSGSDARRNLMLPFSPSSSAARVPVADE